MAWGAGGGRCVEVVLPGAPQVAEALLAVLHERLRRGVPDADLQVVLGLDVLFLPAPATLVNGYSIE